MSEARGDIGAELRAAGARVARGEGGEGGEGGEAGRGVQRAGADARAAVRELSRAWDALVERASDVREALDAAGVEGEGEGDHLAPLARAWSEAVSLRDEAELVRLGAEAQGATDDDLDPEGAAALRAFDDLLRPSLWRLLATRAACDEQIAPWRRVAPAQRARFWWHFEAREVPPHAAEALPAVALLLARFPEAEEALRGLQRARGAWVAAGRASAAEREPVGATVTTLASWVAHRRGARGAFALAAADALLAEQTVFASEALECSLRGARGLVVDVLGERDAASVPTLEPAGAPERKRAGAAVEGAVERFEFALTDEELAWPGGVCVRVRFAGERETREVLVRLPEDSER